MPAVTVAIFVLRCSRLVIKGDWMTPKWHVMSGVGILFTLVAAALALSSRAFSNFLQPLSTRRSGSNRKGVIRWTLQ